MFCIVVSPVYFWGRLIKKPQTGEGTGLHCPKGAAICDQFARAALLLHTCLFFSHWTCQTFSRRTLSM